MSIFTPRVVIPRKKLVICANLELISAALKLTGIKKYLIQGKNRHQMHHSNQNIADHKRVFQGFYRKWRKEFIYDLH